MPLAILTGTVYWLGTDDQGRDVFSVILFGTRLSLAVGVNAVPLSMMIGVVLGLVVGYRRGWVDALIMHVAEIQLTFPSMLVFGTMPRVMPKTSIDEVAVGLLIVAVALSE